LHNRLNDCIKVELEALKREQERDLKNAKSNFYSAQKRGPTSPAKTAKTADAAGVTRAAGNAGAAVPAHTAPVAAAAAASAAAKRPRGRLSLLVASAAAEFPASVISTAAPSREQNRIDLALYGP